MIFTIDNLFTSEQLSRIVKLLQDEDFIDGKTTAGWHAREVKKQYTAFSGSTLCQKN